MVLPGPICDWMIPVHSLCNPTGRTLPPTAGSAAVIDRDLDGTVELRIHRQTLNRGLSQRVSNPQSHQRQ
jgi:hypothetical protein